MFSSKVVIVARQAARINRKENRRSLSSGIACYVELVSEQNHQAKMSTVLVTFISHAPPAHGGTQLSFDWSICSARYDFGRYSRCSQKTHKIIQGGHEVVAPMVKSVKQKRHSPRLQCRHPHIIKQYKTRICTSTFNLSVAALQGPRSPSTARKLSR